VDDIARGTILALKNLGWAVINLGSDQPRSLLEAVGMIESLTGQRANLEFQPAQLADTPATWANIERARTMLGWEPQVDFEDGLARLVAWYGENRTWASQISTVE
jgi:nucleoside-diphosphate-sugar epimerase